MDKQEKKNPYERESQSPVYYISVLLLKMFFSFDDDCKTIYISKKSSKADDYLLWRGSSDTVSFFLPLALRAANTFLPLAVLIRSLKPCLFFLLLRDG